MKFEKLEIKREENRYLRRHSLNKNDPEQGF